MPQEKHAMSQPVRRTKRKLQQISSTQVLSTSPATSGEESPDDSDMMMDEYEKDELQAVVIQYLLMAQKRKGLVKMKNLKKIFPKTFGKKATHEILEKAFGEVKKLFGIEVCVVNTTKGLEVIALKNSLSETLDDNIGLRGKDENKIDVVKKGLLIATLIYVFMAKNPKLSSSVVTDAALIDFLESLNLHEGQVDVRKLIEPKPTAEFISEGWIDYEKSSTKGGVETVLYSWGARAKACIDSKKLMELFCEIDGSKAEEWTDHISVVESA